MPPFPLPAAEDPDAATFARVARVVDGDTVALGDGTEIRLVGIQAPKLPLGRPDFPTWPGAEAARDHLTSLVAGQSVRLIPTGNPTDRHGRRLAHIVASGVWIQGAMLAAGQARVYTFPDNTALAADMLALEATARDQGRGIWADPFYAIRPPEQAGNHLDSFQIVEGTVVRAEQVGRRVYLNFGEDWSQDFTVTIAPDHIGRFEDSLTEVLDLAGRRVRIRGWLYWYNGPAIDLTHPEQLETLGPSAS